MDGTPRRFRIYNNKYQHNVFEIDQDGRKLREHCAHTSHACPQSDHALAQKLLLAKILGVAASMAIDVVLAADRAVGVGSEDGSREGED